MRSRLSIWFRGADIEFSVKLMTTGERCKYVFVIAALSAAATLLRAQEPPPPPAPAPSASTESTTAKNAKHARHVDAFLIRGTVFDDKALSLAGAQLRIRRANEKKYRWTTLTNSRGEFAVRVPPGTDYDVIVQSKGFTKAARPVDAKNGLSDENLVFRMAPITERKK
jgi:Carboxypeptidase regulatory-like domain